MDEHVTRLKIPEVETLDELIAELRRVFESDEVDVNYVHDLMASYKSNPKEWGKYAYFDKFKYTRNLVDNGNGKYNLMLVCWSEGQGSSIHDHANSHCFMKMLSGSLYEVRFDWPSGEAKSLDEPQEMKQIGECELKTNDVAYINDSLGLHRVENRSHVHPAVSLHLYCPPYSKCQTFDQMTGHVNKVKVTFYSKNGRRTPFKNRQQEQQAGISERIERIAEVRTDSD